MILQTFVTYQICVPFERIKQEGYENNGVLNHFTAAPASHTNNPECLSNNILRIRPTYCWKYRVIQKDGLS